MIELSIRNNLDAFLILIKAKLWSSSGAPTLKIALILNFLVLGNIPAIPIPVSGTRTFIKSPTPTPSWKAKISPMTQIEISFVKTIKSPSMICLLI